MLNKINSVILSLRAGRQAQDDLLISFEPALGWRELALSSQACLPPGRLDLGSIQLQTSRPP